MFGLYLLLRIQGQQRGVQADGPGSCQPVYEEAIRKHLVDLKPDGSLWMNMDYFNYCQGLTMTNARFHKLFGGPP